MAMPYGSSEKKSPTISQSAAFGAFAFRPQSWMPSFVYASTCPWTSAWKAAG